MQTTEGLKQAVQNLIEAGTTFDISQLELIYHDTMEVIMVNHSGEKMISNKENFKDLFKMKLKNGDAPLNTWAKFHHISVSNDKGHVILTRKVNLTGTEETIILNMDLIWESGRWQVLRESIFSQPE